MHACNAPLVRVGFEDAVVRELASAMLNGTVALFFLK